MTDGSDTRIERRKTARIVGKAGPKEVSAEYHRHEQQVLKRMVDGGYEIERRGDQLVFVRPGSRISVASGIPSGVLAELIHAGAVKCHSRAGRIWFAATEEGRLRHARGQAGDDNPFAAQHRTLESREIAGREGVEAVRVNTREDPLDLFRRGRFGGGLVGAAEIEAADRLRRDFAMAQSIPQITANWSRLVVDGAGFQAGLSKSEVVLEARRRVDAAMRAVGPDFSGILLDICGFSKGLETLEKENGFPLRSGKVVVGLALRELARHYGLANAAFGPARTATRHWGAADYRPKIKAG